MDKIDNDFYSINGTTVEIMLDNTLTDFDREVLMRLYQPIIKQTSLNILLYLYSLVPTKEREECVPHKVILTNMGISESNFVIERKKLEACGLLEVYVKEQIYIYVLKRVLTPYEFFNNAELVQVLCGIISQEEVERLQYDLLLRKLEPKNFTNITHSFDDVYQVTFGNDIYQFQGVDTTNHGIKVKKEQFNIDHYRLLLETKTNMINPSYLTNLEFLDKIVRLAFLFGLSVEEMVNSTILAVDSNKEVVDKELIYQVKRCYDGHQTKVMVNAKAGKGVHSDKKIKALENTSPNELVYTKFKTRLTASENEMINTLLEKTGLSIGVINVCLIYVISKLNGEIPNITYFEKVLNTWIRKEITTTQQALDFIENNNLQSGKKSSTSKRVVPVSSSITQNNNTDNNNQKPDEEAEDILDTLFKDTVK